SSRRRRTRFSRDWSSDVCSSDLERSERLASGIRSGQVVQRGDDSLHPERTLAAGPQLFFKDPESPLAEYTIQPGRRSSVLQLLRSEERRVGKSIDVQGGRADQKE